MQLFRHCRAAAFRIYTRESVTAIPRIHASRRIQAWRADDGREAVPIAGVAPPPVPETAGPALRRAA
jgi:hypothetical protein